MASGKLLNSTHLVVRFYSERWDWWGQAITVKRKSTDSLEREIVHRQGVSL